MTKREVDVVISEQAKLQLKHMPDVDSEKFLDWFCKIRRISAGGGDLVGYLDYLEEHKNG